MRTVVARTADEWRDSLARHSRTGQEVWLIARQGSAAPGIRHGKERHR
jgi:hypothetical protein